MRSIKNILFSSTYGWNPGDDFILFGILNLLKALSIDFNPIIYNRNPERHAFRMIFDKETNLHFGSQVLTTNLYQTLKNSLPQIDNSWMPVLNLTNIDYVIFAGSPEWNGEMNRLLVEPLNQTSIPTLYLGIGAFEEIATARLENFAAHDQFSFQRAALITARDERVANIIAPNPVHTLPCPALFSSGIKTQKKPTQIRRIALSTQSFLGDNGNLQTISSDVFEYCKTLFLLLNKHYECELICHYLHELAYCEDIFGQHMPVRYSYNADDYISIYDSFDFVVTTRVHGLGMAASLGIPGFLISHSTRSATGLGFLGKLIVPQDVKPTDILSQIQAYDLKQHSDALSTHKENVFMEYKKLLAPIFE